MSANVFDYVLIGSGPAAVSGLQIINRDRAVAVISGVNRIAVPRESVHPKVQAVSVESREEPGVCVAYTRSESPGKPLFSSAIAGGLANYWGQQFVRYEEHDEWPRYVFENFEAYEKECASIERAFVRSGGDEIRRFEEAGDQYSIRAPQLLTGCTSHPRSGLMAMRHSLRDEINRTGARLFDDRARSVTRKQGVWEILLESGQSITGKKVILAAGVIGTSELIANSFPDVAEIEFSDHSPWMLYTIGLGKLYRQRPATLRNHFNALTLEKTSNAATQMFASLYDMRQADLNLLLASTLGRTVSLLRGMRAPIGSQLLKPVQIWTPTSFDTIVVDLKKRESRSVSSTPREAGKDDVLAQTVSVLTTLGAKCLKASPTSPGYGFHYHNLQIKAGGGKRDNVAEFLENRCGDSIKCIDASVLRHIGLRPHTLTSMAAARALTRTIVN
ncbi:hypothetical protein [Paraburkholderia acidiphila]|uniref:Uncharacterized protein n=1 Tax=Paraburkholderia acidiphila TaxID=2571747 RepID=A0A7Z2G2H4_9BURK|nr:hypothetical protein [Paraburkholderia acidiphila]QGZ54028.1 hypothetical protein FAZ97_03345 [Paraburkholderia acidiphila]